ncbi:hypothetical protein PF004_g4530 [Phytophthora fragariae]|uniref:Uncharacterized protein n=1 Tax=Phytophthora fragariae TaxID=53985 RepID=A0A6G0SB10_9STRA|nr:hypothetical protein PF004_g4530 [Phytophthora fragariae]KAE9353962.1 hypothetical protein PF008_g4739 [Phytophthora fragariae]
MRTLGSVDLEAKLDQEAKDATAELESAVELLTKLAKSDGKMSSNKRRNDDLSTHETHEKKPRFSGAALATTTKSAKSRWDFLDTVGKTCNERGHTTNYHDRHVAQQARAQDGHDQDRQ